MGDQTPSSSIMDEVIAVDPDYQNDVAKSTEEKPVGFFARIMKRRGEAKTETEAETGTKDGAEAGEKKEKKEDVGMGNYSVGYFSLLVVIVQ